MTVRERFKSWREWTDESQEVFARRIGVHQTHISAIEHGRRSPGVTIAVAIERESVGWPDGPIMVAEWAREPVESEPEAAA